jgi:hypothetical protein
MESSKEKCSQDGLDKSLVKACKKRDKNLAEGLDVANIKRGAHVNIKYKNRRGNYALLTSILTSKKYTKCFYKRKVTFQTLLENGVSVNGRTGDGRTPLLIAAAEHAEILLKCC